MPRVGRSALWGIAVLVVALVAAGWLLPRMLSSPPARQRVERILSDALGRQVTIDALEVRPDEPVVMLRGVEVANRSEFVGVDGAGPLLRAHKILLEIELSELLDRRVVGLMRAEGVELVVLKRDGRTGLHGLGRSSDAGRDRGARPKEPVELDLRLELDGASLRYRDLDRQQQLDLEGVDLRARLSNRDQQREGRIALRVPKVDLHGSPIRDVGLEAQADGERIRVVRLAAAVGTTGRVQGQGWLHLQPEPSTRDWSFTLSVTDATLDGVLMPVVAAVFPPLVAAMTSMDDETDLAGDLSATVELRGTGLSWSAIKPTLTGRAEVRLDGIHLPASALVVRLATLAGGGATPWVLETGAAEVEIVDGWVRLTKVEAEGGRVRSQVQGQVSLDGKLDLLVDVMPLVEAFGGGMYAQAARYTTSIPVRIGGTLADPAIEPPQMKDVARGVLGGLIRRATVGTPPSSP